jgi:hypothetical protein
MRIVAVVRPHCAMQMRAALRTGEQLIAVSDPASAVSGLRRAPTVLLVDPSILQSGQTHSLIAEANSVGVPSVVYLGSECEAGGEVLSVISATRASLLTAGHLHDANLFRHRLDRLQAVAVTTEVLRRLAPRLRLLPAPLAHSIMMMFAIPGPNDSPKELAASSGMARRSIDRWIGRVGISSARLLVAAARLAGLHDAITTNGETIAAALRSGKLGSLVAVRRQCKTLCGYSLSDLRRASKVDLIAKMEAGLRPRRHTPLTSYPLSVPSYAGDRPHVPVVVVTSDGPFERV